MFPCPCPPPPHQALHHKALAQIEVLQARGDALEADNARLRAAPLGDMASDPLDDAVTAQLQVKALHCHSVLPVHLLHSP